MSGEKIKNKGYGKGTPKNSIFVGNLSFNTTEEHLRTFFSTAGTVTGVRIVIDKDTQKSKGFAFVEFLDAGTALSAIRNLDGQELNNRKLRVSYSNNGGLKDIAKQIGQVVPENPYNNTHSGHNGHQNQHNQHNQPSIEAVLSTYQLHELYDLLNCMKTMCIEDSNKAKSILQQYPHLITTMQDIQQKLGMH